MLFLDSFGNILVWYYDDNGIEFFKSFYLVNNDVEYFVICYREIYDIVYIVFGYKFDEIGELEL